MGRTISIAIVVLGAAAAGILASRTLFPTGPAGGLYEGAPASRGLRIAVGDNLFSIGAVARRDRDGSIRRGDGMGAPLPAARLDVAGPPESGRWLDSVSIPISSLQPFDPIEVRVFDHRSRAILGAAPWTGTGWELADGRLELRRIGAPLPDEVDVWLRVNQALRTDPVAAVTARAGAAAAGPAGTFTMRELRRGSWSYTTRATAGAPGGEIVWESAFGDGERVTTAVIDFLPVAGARSQKHAVCAIAKDGRRVVPDFPHFLAFLPARASEVVALGVPLEELAAVELRPFRGRDAFFFDGVRLPAAGRDFAAPPAVEVPVGGKEIDVVSKALDPLPVRVRVLAGARVSGVAGLTAGPSLRLVPPPYPKTDAETTAVWEIPGVSIDAASFDLLGGGIAHGSSSRSGAVMPGRWTMGWTDAGVPIGRVEAARLTIAPPPVVAGTAGR